MSFEEKLSKIKNKLNAATPGPWEMWAGTGGFIFNAPEEWPITARGKKLAGHYPEPAECLAIVRRSPDQDFIGTAPTHMNALIKVVEKLEKEIRGYCYCGDEQCQPCFVLDEATEILECV